MSIFSFFKKKTDSQEAQNKSKLIVGNLNTSTSQLLKLSTKLKKEGELDEAIKILQQVLITAKKESIAYDIAPFLRLPMYLLQADRADEGWRELNRLIVEGYPKQTTDMKIKVMDHSNIYGKMRLFLQREKKNVEAVKFGIFSNICWSKGLKLQKRGKEFNSSKTKKAISESIMPLLKKAKINDKEQELVKVIHTAYKDIENLNLGSLGREIDTIVNN